MYGYLLQDWTTIESASNSPFTQSEADWMSFQAFQDIVLFLEVRAVDLEGLTSLGLAFQTAPAKDEALFSAMQFTTSTTPSQSVTLAASSSPVVCPVLLANGPLVPLARWVRWQLVPNGSVTSGKVWSVCFRIHCAANAVGVLS